MNLPDDRIDTMSDEDLGKYVRETPVFRLAIACARFEDAVIELRESDELAWDHLMKETLKGQRRGNVKSRKTVEDVVNSFLSSIEEYATLARSPEDIAERATEGKVDT